MGVLILPFPVSFFLRILAILIVVILPITELFVPHSLVSTVEAKGNRAARAQNLSTRKIKITKQKTPMKSYDEIEAAKKKAEQQRREAWEAGGYEESLRKKMAEENTRKAREEEQQKAKKELRRLKNMELTKRRSEGGQKLPRMATKIDEWKKFRKEMLKAMNERDVSRDYVENVLSIDTQWVSAFNKYIEIYNAALSEPGSLIGTEVLTKIALLEKLIILQ